MLCQGGAWAAMASKMIESAEMDLWTTSMMGVSATASLFGLGAVQLFASSVVHTVSVDANADLQSRMEACVSADGDDSIARSLVDVNVYAHTLLGTRGKKKTFRLQNMRRVGETPRFVAIKANPEDKFNYLLDYKRGYFADRRVLSADAFFNSIRTDGASTTTALDPIVNSKNASSSERSPIARSSVASTSSSPPPPPPPPSEGASHQRRAPSKRKQKKRRKGTRR